MATTTSPAVDRSRARHELLAMMAQTIDKQNLLMASRHLQVLGTECENEPESFIGLCVIQKWVAEVLLCSNDMPQATFEIVFNAGVSPDMVLDFGTGIPLMLGAIRKDNTRLLRVLFDRGVYANPHRDRSMLWYAVHNKAAGCMHVLLEAGFRPDSEDLRVAVHNGHPDFVAQLITSGARVTKDVCIAFAKLMIKSNCLDDLVQIAKCLDPFIGDPSLAPYNHQFFGGIASMTGRPTALSESLRKLSMKWASGYTHWFTLTVPNPAMAKVATDMQATLPKVTHFGVSRPKPVQEQTAPTQ